MRNCMGGTFGGNSLVMTSQHGVEHCQVGAEAIFTAEGAEGRRG